MKRRRQPTAEDITAAFQALRQARDNDENITLREFTDHTGITAAQVYRHFGSWLHFRHELGLTRQANNKHRWSRDELFQGYHRAVESRGRLPTVYEFQRLTGISYDALARRIGPREQLVEAYAQWLRQQPWPEPTGWNRQVHPNPARDVTWLRNRWINLKVAFDLRSSCFKGREPDACDLLIVLEHDWPACPVKVLELHRFLPRGEPRPRPEAEARMLPPSRLPWRGA